MTLQLNGTDGVTFNDGSEQWAAASPIGTKNLIINGDMRIAQRGTSAVTLSGTPNTGFAVDRFLVVNVTDGTISFQQSSDVPTGQGFDKSLVATITTADTSLASGQHAFIRQQIEGNNCYHLQWGTSNAKDVTLSFWVKCSLTGTFGGTISNNARNRSYPFTYVISSANTWEKKTITIPADTTGTWATDNTTGLSLSISLGSSSTQSDTAGSWYSSNLTNATGATSVVGTTGATWYITGVQLEVGDTATPFEVIPYDMQLARCQRYYNRIYDIWGDQSVHTVNCRLMTRVDYPVQMRANPTVTTNTVSNTSCTFQGSNRTNTNGTHLYANSTTATGDAFFVINNMESNAEL